MLKDVLIEPSCTAKRAEQFIREIIEKYRDENFTVTFQLMLENSTLVGAPHGDIFYTVIVSIYEREMAS